MASGALTASLACSLLQLGVNEARVRRIKYVTRSSETSRTIEMATEEVGVREVSPDSVAVGGSPSVPSGGGLTFRAAPRHDMPTEKSSDATPNPSSFSERLLRAIGIRRISDEEYVGMLKKERDGHLERIKELEEQLQKESEGVKDNE